jgi:hypothetical protein
MHRNQVLRFCRKPLDLLTQLCNVIIDRPAERIGPHAPYFVHQLIPADGFTAPPNEIPEEIKLPGSQTKKSAGLGRMVALEIQFNFPEAEMLDAALGRETPKRRSSQNAIRHGMLAATVVLPAEASSGFKDLTDAFYGRFQPADNVEVGLIEDMCAAWWKTRRGWAIENRLLSDAIDAQVSGDELGRMTAAFRDLANSREFPLIHRYETRFQLQFHRALNNLLALRKAVDPDEFPGLNGPVFEHPTHDPELPSDDPPLLTEPQSNQSEDVLKLDIPNEPSPICGHLDPKSSPERSEASNPSQGQPALRRRHRSGPRFRLGHAHAGHHR